MNIGTYVLRPLAMALVGSWLAAHGVWAGAQAGASPRLTLADLLGELNRANPQLAQARQSYVSAKAIGPQLAAPDNPLIGFVENPVFRNPLNLHSSTGFFWYLQQPISWPGKKRLAGEIADDQAEVLNTQVGQLLLQLAGQLRSNFFQLLFVQEQLRINRETIRRLETIKQVAKVRYAQNAAAYVDYLNAQVAQSSAQNDQFALERQAATLRQTLNTLIGRDPGGALELAGELAPYRAPRQTLTELEQLALDAHPAIAGARLNTAAAEKGLDLAYLGYRPNFQIQVSLNSSNPPYGVTQAGSYGIELDVIAPVWWWRKEKYGVDQAQAALIASRANETAVRQQTLLGVNSAYNALAQALNQLEFFRSRQLPEARTAYRLAISNYSTSGIAFADLLTAQANLRTAELGLLQSQNAAHQAYAGLVAAVGTDPE